MTRVLRATSGLLACVGIVVLALAVLAFPSQPAWASPSPEPDECSTTCAGETEEEAAACGSEACAARHCWRTYPACDGWCILLWCATRTQDNVNYYCACGNF